MLRSSVTFSHGGRSFTFAGDVDRVMKGKLSCDCTKSRLIREYCDPRFPSLKCGHTITVVSMVDAPVVDVPVIDDRQAPRECEIGL